MAQFFPGLKSRNDVTRLRAARDLQKYVSTELRELPAESYSTKLDEVNQSIFSLISSQEVHEKKGGILAIGEGQRLKELPTDAFDKLSTTCCTVNSLLHDTVSHTCTHTAVFLSLSLSQ